MKVTIFQYRLFHYRTKLFELMRVKCAQRGIRLDVVYGQPYRDEIKKKDTGRLDWAIPVKNTYFPIKEKKDICWQPAPAVVQDADLFVFMHENRLLANYYWLLRRRLGRSPRVAFWGHGKDFQSNAPGGLRERWKEKTLRWPDWWFGYTQHTRQIVEGSGFPPGQITVLNNAIDNVEFKEQLYMVSEADIARQRDELGLDAGDFVGIYCGSLYPDKRLDQLFEIADRLQQRAAHFRLLIVGSGAQQPYVEQMCATRPWIRFVGPRHGAGKAVLFRLAALTLCPGAVGLNILDAFIAGVPLITMAGAKHGPEICFLRNGVDGWLIGDAIDEYVSRVLRLMDTPMELQQMQQMALQAGEIYTVENMADNFVEGITRCLNAATPAQGGVMA
ncbi:MULTISPECIES: glycosyltransferase family 4 protein [Aquitalea]|jgi:glycosyltransferase involved in cell wall biosynthesis|uniref:glycosyltransferase family 4 protein n=1 Tax=Aquitalea TaxID=407217 RepID=UPI001357207D|nr:MULTISPECIES: glycosyltransferase family 4 protein [Aquitalea]